jgi:hypothetical protein
LKLVILTKYNGQPKGNEMGKVYRMYGRGMHSRFVGKTRRDKATIKI